MIAESPFTMGLPMDDEMDFEQAQHYLSQKPEAELSYPFDPDVSVFKVMNKMFALISPNGGKSPNKQPQMNLKCDPEQAQELRDVFEAVIPGYHMNKPFKYNAVN